MQRGPGGREAAGIFGDHMVVQRGMKAPIWGSAEPGEKVVATPARATIVGEAVILTADEVPEPKSVRYGWDDDPVCTLYNEGGLPAAPFRTE